MALPPPSPGLAMKLAALRKRYDLEPVFPTVEPPAPPAPPQPPKPGMLERVGAAMAVPKRYLIDLPANLNASETLRERAHRFLQTGDEQYAPVPAGELMKEGFVGQPEAHEPPIVQHAKGVSRGLVGRVTDAATDPLNIALIAGGAGLAKAAPVVSKAMHIGFAGMMAKGTYDAAQAAYQEYRKDGWTPAVSEHATEAAVDAGFLTAVGMGLLRRQPTAPPGRPGGGALVRYEPGGPGAPPITARPAPRRRGLLGEPIIDVEGITINPPSRGLPPVPRQIPEGGPFRAPGGEEVPPQPPPPPEPPAQPPPEAAPPQAKTPYEPPVIGKMSQEAVQKAIQGIDARIAEAEAKQLYLEVADLVRQRQALSEAYSVPQAPPPAPPPRAPYEPPALLDEPALVKMILKLQQEAADARTAGDLGTAATRDAVAESIRAQLRARQAAAAAPPPPVAAPEGRVAAPGAVPEPAGEVPGPRAGTRAQIAPEPALAPEPIEAAQARAKAARPAVQELVERAETGAEPAPPELGVIEGRPPRELAKAPEAPGAAPAVGGVTVPEPVRMAEEAPRPAVERLPVAGPPEAGPVIEMRRAPAEAQPILDFLRSIVAPDRVDQFEQAVAAALPPGTPWTSDTLEPLRGQVDEDVLTAAQTLLETGVPAPEPTVEEVQAKMQPRSPWVQAMELETGLNEPPTQLEPDVNAPVPDWAKEAEAAVRQRVAAAVPKLIPELEKRETLVHSTDSLEGLEGILSKGMRRGHYSAPRGQGSDGPYILVYPKSAGSGVEVPHRPGDYTGKLKGKPDAIVFEPESLDGDPAENWNEAKAVADKHGVPIIRAQMDPTTDELVIPGGFPSTRKPVTPQLPPPVEGVTYGLPSFVGAPHVPKAVEPPKKLKDVIAWAASGDAKYQGFTGDLADRLDAMSIVAAEDPQRSKWPPKTIDAAADWVRRHPEFAAPAPTPAPEAPPAEPEAKVTKAKIIPTRAGVVAVPIPEEPPEPPPPPTPAAEGPPSAAPAAEEFVAPREELVPPQEPLTPEDAGALAEMLTSARDQQVELGEKPALPARPSPEQVADVLQQGFDISVTPAEAEMIAAEMAGAPAAPPAPPQEAPRAEEEARPGERVAEGPAGGALPGELPPPGGEARGGREVRGVPAPAEGEVPRDRGPAVEVGEGGVLPSRGAGERRRVPEAVGVGAEPGVAVEPTVAEPAPGSAAEARDLEPPEQSPAPAPQGSLTNNLPTAELTEPRPTVDAPKDLNLYSAPGDVLGEGRSWNQKLDDNISAVRLLKDLEATGRRATIEEQISLAKYVGWGGLPAVFDRWKAASNDRARFEKATEQVRELLTETEWEAASLSTPNAHYTGAPVVLGMWDALSELGLSPGQRVLEPAMGTGNFFTLAPVNLRKTGVELDSLTGRIARQIHPNASIHLMGLEQTTLPDNFYDLVIGNPPFGKIQVFDPAYRSDRIATESIHNYMVLKSLDKARPGGLVAVVTSRYTMDAKDTSIRNRILDRGDLIAAVRLPNTTFEKNANTKVITDILVFRKRAVGEPRPATAPWLETKENPNDYYGTADTQGRPVWRNAIWDTKGGKILGKEALGRGMYGSSEYTVEGEAPTRKEIKAALLSTMKANGVDSSTEAGQIFRQLALEAPAKVRERVAATPEQIKALKPGNFVVKDGKLYQAAGAELEEWEPPISKNPEYAETPEEKDLATKALAALRKKIDDYMPLRDATKELVAAQVDPTTTDAVFSALQKKTEKLYDAFVKKHGWVSEQDRDLGDDTDFPNVLALEKDYTPPQRAGKGKARKVVAPAKAEKADILKKRVAGVAARAEKAESTREAYLISLGETGTLDWNRMAELTGKDVATLQADARGEGLVYFDPQSRQLVQAEEYLSGNVRKKLKQAEAAAKEDASLAPNVDALKLVLPQPKTADQIHAPLGSGWIPGSYIKGFVKHLLGTERTWLAEEIAPRYIESIASWVVPGLDRALGQHSTAGSDVWGQDYYTAAEAIDDILNLKTPQIFAKDAEGKQYLDVERTENAKEIKTKIEQAWKEWVWSDKARADELGEIFNDNFYGTVPRNYNGAHLTLPGQNRSILKNGTLYPFQKDAVWMMLQRPNTLVALPVGAGKTYTAVSAIMEARRMGTARKPVVLAPRAVLRQWVRSFKQLYPASQLLYVDPEDMSPRSRGRLMSRIATGDYDAVLVTHEGFKKLPLARETVEKHIGAELANLERAFEDILRERYEDFAKTSDEDVKAYVDALIAWQEESAKHERDPRYRKDRKAKFIPWVSDDPDAEPLISLAKWRKVSQPKPPKVDVSSLRGESPSTKRLVKQLAAAKLNLKAKIARLVDPTRKDRNISFEQLGVDMMVVDESHAYKRLFFTSKMERVPGLPTDFSSRAYDLLMKMRVTQERNGGGGVHFLTGTPITNTIAEMYSLFRYLDPETLRENGLEHFDAWAKTYATIATGIEVDPTGANMRTATRFNQFVNLGSLLRAFRSFTYYKSVEELGLDLPKLMLNENNERRPRTMIVPKTDLTTNYVKFLVARAQRLKAGGKNITDDNPLLITTDGMKAAIDMRLIHPDYPDDPGSKLNQAVRGIFDRWKAGIEAKTTQLVFLDIGTPGKGTTRVWERNPDGSLIRKFDTPKLNLYADIRDKLVGLGVPKNEIEFIHDWTATDADPDKPMKLYDAMNAGTVRIMLASSDKGGVGVNVQKRLKHGHHLDVPYTPDKIEQREGRWVRQGNVNPEVETVNWVTKGTFDIYKWQLVQQKASFISKALSGNLEADTVEDLGFTAMTAEEVIALGSDNPLVRDRLMVQKKLEQRERLYQAWLDRRRKLGHSLGAKEQQVANLGKLLESSDKDVATRTEKLEFMPGIGADGWKAYEGYLREATRSIVPTVAKEAKAQLEAWQKEEAALSGHETISDRDRAAALLHQITSAMTLVSFADVHKTASELVGTWRGLPVVQKQSPFVGYSGQIFTRGEAPANTLASIEAVTGKHALQTWNDKLKTNLAEAQKEIVTLKEQALGKFEYADEIAQLTKDLYDVEEKLGLHKREQGTSAVAAQEEPGAGGGGGEEPPDDSVPYEDSPDPEDAGGEGPIDPPEGRPDQGAQPGENGWDRRVRNAKDRTRRRGRGGTANMGVDPMAFWDAVTLGVDALARGARNFARWVAQVVSGLGGNPGEGMLQRIWRASQEWFRSRTIRVRQRVRPVASIPAFEPPAAGRKGPKLSAEEVRNAAQAASEGGPAPAWDRPGGTPDSDINLHRVRDEGGLRDLQAKMVAQLEKSLGRKARQVRSWAQVRAEAVLSGITEADFHRMLRRKGALTDMEITAGRILRQESAKAVQAALDRWNELKARADTAPGAQRETLLQEALDAQREYLANVAQYAAIAADTVGAGTEAGRALAAHRMLIETLTPEERYIKRLFRGMEPNERQIAALTDALMRQDHRRIMEISRQILKPGALSMVTEYFVNSILSGLSTPAANMTGNTLFMGMLAAERGFAARLEQVGLRQFLERILTGEAQPRERMAGEGWAFGKALFKTKFGLWRGIAESWEAIRNETAYSQLKGEYHGQAIPGIVGKTIRTPGRVLEAQDLGAKWAVKAAEKSSQILREATIEGKRKGWNAERVETRMRELENELNRYIELEEARKQGVRLDASEMDYLVRNRTGLGKMYREMDRVATEATFRDEVMKLTRYVLLARHSYPWLTFLVPFIKTPERILVQAFRRTPVGLAKTLYNIQQGKISGGVASDRLAAGVIGTFASAAFYMMAQDGLITGGGPADLDERKNWEKTGKKPYAIKVGNKWVSLARVEPLATTLGFAADLSEAKDEKTAGDVWDKLHYSVINNIANKTYLQSLIGAAEAIGDPERYGARLEKQLVGAIVPNILASAARAIDPTVRQTDDISGTLMARIPLLSKNLPAKLTGTGEPLQRGEDPISRFMSPFRYATEAGPEANLERLFLETGYNPAAPPKDMTVGGKKILLTEDERALYGAYAARATAYARKLAANRDWTGLDTIQKEEVLRRIYRFAHDAARRELFGRILRRVRSGQYKLKEAK